MQIAELFGSERLFEQFLQDKHADGTGKISAAFAGIDLRNQGIDALFAHGGLSFELVPKLIFQTYAGGMASGDNHRYFAHHFFRKASMDTTSALVPEGLAHDAAEREAAASLTGAVVSSDEGGVVSSNAKLSPNLA